MRDAIVHLATRHQRQLRAWKGEEKQGTWNSFETYTTPSCFPSCSWLEILAECTSVTESSSIKTKKVFATVRMGDLKEESRSKIRKWSDLECVFESKANRVCWVGGSAVGGPYRRRDVKNWVEHDRLVGWRFYWWGEATGGAVGGADWSSVFDILYLRGQWAIQEESSSRQFMGHVQSGRTHLSH